MWAPAKLAAVEVSLLFSESSALHSGHIWNDNASCLPAVVPTAHWCRAPMLPWPALPFHHSQAGTLYDATGGVCRRLQLSFLPHSLCLAAGSGKVWGVEQEGPGCPEEWLLTELSGFGMAGIWVTQGRQAQRDCTSQGGRVSLDLHQCSRPGWGQNPWCRCEEVVRRNVQNYSRSRRRRHCLHCRIKWSCFHLDQTVDWWVMQGWDEEGTVCRKTEILLKSTWEATLQLTNISAFNSDINNSAVLVLFKMSAIGSLYIYSPDLYGNTSCGQISALNTAAEVIKSLSPSVLRGPEITT